MPKNNAMNIKIRQAIAGLVLLGTFGVCCAQDQFASINASKPGRHETRNKVGLNDLLPQLDTAKSMATYERLAGGFNKLSASNRKDWLPFYYEAYCHLRLALLTADKKLIDVYCDRAAAILAALEQRDENNTEVMCLQALELSARIRVNVMDRGVAYSTLSNEILEAVLEKDPENPRAWLLRGQNVFNMPDIFGGGKEPAKPYFEAAVACFEKQKNTNLKPRWGHQVATLMLEKCQ